MIGVLVFFAAYTATMLLTLKFVGWLGRLAT